MRNFYRVTAQSEPFFVQSQKAEGGQVSMCHIVLQELAASTKTAMWPRCSASRQEGDSKQANWWRQHSDSLPASTTDRCIRM